MAGSGPDRVVARQADVDEGADRLQVADRRDPADDEPGRLTDHLGAGQLHGVQLEQVGDLRRVDPVGPGGEDEQRLGRRAGPAACGVAAKTSEFAIWAGMTPRYAAAWAAVRAAPSRTTTSVVTPTPASASRTRVTAGWARIAARACSGIPAGAVVIAASTPVARHVRTVMADRALTGVFLSRRSGAYPA